MEAPPENSQSQDPKKTPILTANPQYPSTASQPTTAPELCPPKWRLKPTNSNNNNNHYPSRTLRIKSLARSLLLKQLTITTTTTTTTKPALPSLPPTLQTPTPPRRKMRMKDSDDYLTARAANPRTGLVSPSLPSPTPQTPESPAEALKLRVQLDRSPILPGAGEEQPPRPALTRADSARKISARWRAGAQGWALEDAAAAAAAAASPRASDATASAGVADLVGAFFPQDENESALARLQRRPLRPAAEDRFVLPMPSAREPQPYAYPGRSAEEIRAFEHYRSKARKTSGEGWDRRCVRGGGGGVRKTGSADTGGCGGRRVVLAAEQERGRNRAAVPGPVPVQGHFSKRREGTVIRRGGPSLEVLDGTAASEAEQMLRGAALFAPYSSPKTPARRSSGSGGGGRRPHANAHGPITHLSQLPKLHLVHPELASLPMPKIRRAADHALATAAAAGSRSCSLGCDRSTEPGACQRLASLQHQNPNSHPLFTAPDPPLQSPLHHLTALLTFLLRSLRAAHTRLSAHVHIRVPTPAMVATLASPDASVEEKLAASRVLMSLVGQVVAVLMAVTLVWRVCDAVLGVLGVVFWPLRGPVRLAWWALRG